MNRIINMILRIVVLELVRRGTNFAINRMSRRGQNSQYDADEDRQIGDQSQMDKRDMRRRIRTTRRF